ncbi:MAG TPA: 3-hydroxyacyl-CoA dehydrogenase, partial [Alphaproteobacteria bacterium]|nr:3-hydroxyacyl-CoA dehydrogenase [Alphaproteobacteria bacterium]
MSVAGKHIMVTGGASGLGHATVRYLKSRDAFPIIADLPGERLDQAVDELGVAFMALDVTDAQGAADAIGKLEQLDGAVNCAGIAPAKKILGRNGPHDLDLYAKVISVNLIGTFNITRLAAEKMADNQPDQHGQRGAIVNTASVAAFEGQIGQAAYASSKGGVVSLNLVAARELASIGVRVNTIAPGIFGTPML